MNKRMMKLCSGMAAFLLLVGCGAEDEGATTTTADATTAVTTTTQAAIDTTVTQAATTAKKEPISQGTTTTTQSTRKTVTTRSKSSQVVSDLYPIDRVLTPEQAAAAVKHVDGSLFTKIPKETAAVTKYDPTLPFSHHTGIAYFKGKIYGMFTQHGEAVLDPKLTTGQYTYGEDYPGQCLSVASSSNFYDWSAPQMVVKAWKGLIGDVAIIPTGIYAADDKLFVTFMAHDFGGVYWSGGKFQPKGDDSAAATTTTWMCYSTDGVNWTDPVNFGALVGGTIKQLKSGRWWAGGYYTDKAKPDGFFWEAGGITPDQIMRAKSRGATIFTERSWYENRDGVLFDMARTDTGVMWLSQSYDGGDTWSEAYPTNFTSDNNQFPMISLPDGRIVAVGSPGRDAGGPWDMWPLNLYISEDGYDFNKAYTISDEKYQLKKPGYSKGGSFGYPKLMIQGDYLYVYHSKMKEVIEIHRIKLSDIK